MLTDGQLVAAVAGICVLAVALLVLGRRGRRASGHAHDDVVPTGSIVLARTHDGTQYQGALVEDAGPVADQYLVLSGPIVFRRAGSEPETMPPAWDRLALPRADVAEVWTRSTPTAEPPTGRGRAVVADPTPVGDAPTPIRPPVYDPSRVASEAVAEEPGDDVRTSRRHARRRTGTAT